MDCFSFFEISMRGEDDVIAPDNLITIITPNNPSKPSNPHNSDNPKALRGGDAGQGRRDDAFRYS
jgi:hypothetical protein